MQTIHTKGFNEAVTQVVFLRGSLTLEIADPFLRPLLFSAGLVFLLH